MSSVRFRRIPWQVGLVATLVVPRAARADERVNRCADGAESGQELRDGGKLVEAREAFLACAQTSCPKAVRESCGDWLSDVERRIPSVVVSVKDVAGRDVPSVRATLDGKPLPDNVTTVAVRVNPGTHALRCEAEGFASVEQSLTLREGEGVRVVSITAPSQKVEAPPALRVERSGPPIVPLAFAGLAVVSLGVFTWAGVSGANDYKQLERDCAPNCRREDLDSVRTRFVVADVALVVAVVSGGVALGTYLFGRGASHDDGR